MAPTTKIRNHASDPVFVQLWSTQIELRIGESRRGESQIAHLTAREAQQIAIALLNHAESLLAKSAKASYFPAQK